MFKKVLFYLYNLISKWHSKFRIELYSNKWKKQIVLGNNFYFDQSSSILLQTSEAKINIGDDVLFRKYCSIICSGLGIITIGNNVFFNNYCSVNCLESVIIGDNTIFGEAVHIYDHNHSFDENELFIKDQPLKSKKVLIGSNSWIGSGTIILAGVSIGNNVVIGAGNLIYKSIADNTIIKSKREIIQSHFNEN